MIERRQSGGEELAELARARSIGGVDGGGFLAIDASSLREV
jgi:hypothetical protein